MTDKKIDDKSILCECGYLVRGTSEKHVISNLKKHKDSKRHKEQIKIINTQKRINVVKGGIN